MDALRMAMEQAAQQLGLVTHAQLVALGWTRHQIGYRLTVGELVGLHEGVYRFAAAPATHEQDLLAACLAIGSEAAVSHRAAATLHRLGAPARGTIEVTSARWRSPELAGVTVHRIRDLRRLWVTKVGGVSVTTPARTLVDVGACVPLGSLSRMLDTAVGRRLTTCREVRATMEAVARKGRAGVGAIRRLLDERTGEDSPAGVLEARMVTLLRLHGVEGLVAEHTVLDEQGQFVGRVDFADVETALVVEVDGFEAHSSHRRFESDRARQNELARLGYTVLRFTWSDVNSLSERVAWTIRTTRARLLGTLEPNNPA